MKHAKLQDVVGLLDTALQLHDIKCFKAAASQFIVCGEMLFTMLRRFLAAESCAEKVCISTDDIKDTIRPIKQCVVHIEQILLDVLFQEERATYPEMYVRTEARHIPQPSQDSPGVSISSSCAAVQDHADKREPKCMICGTTFTLFRRRHLCRGCHKTICVACAATPVSMFQKRHPTLHCRECVLPALRSMSCPSGAEAAVVSARASSVNIPTYQHVFRVAKALIIPHSRWEMLILHNYHHWHNPSLLEHHRRFLDTLWASQTADSAGLVHQHLSLLLSQQGNPLFATLQAFTGAFQDMVQEWRQQGPGEPLRPLVQRAKAEIEGFKQCVSGTLQEVLFGKDFRDVVEEELTGLLEKEVESRAYPVFRNLYRLIFRDRDQLLNTIMESKAAQEAYEDIASPYRQNYFVISDMLSKVTLCTTGEDKIMTLMEAMKRIHILLDTCTGKIVKGRTAWDSKNPLNDEVDEMEKVVEGIMITEVTGCYLDPPDSEPISLLEDHYKSHGIQWVWKPNTNILEAPGFAQWLEAHLQNGVRTLIVGGCTTTSCVRLSSQAVQRQYGDQGLQVVVDLSLCGARTDNYDPVQTLRDRKLVRIYGDAAVGRSAVELAVAQMREAGVEVVDSYNWDPP